MQIVLGSVRKKINKFYYLEDKEYFIKTEPDDDRSFYQINIKIYDNASTIEIHYFETHNVINNKMYDDTETYAKNYMSDRDYYIIPNINREILKKYYDLFTK
jgi:hypothetical protein